LPVFVEIVGHQRVELVPAHLPRGHVVHETGEIVGEAERGGGRVGDQRRARSCAHLRRIGPFQDQFAQQQTALQRLDRFRQRERHLAGRGFGERDLVFIQIAERHDAWQQRRVAEPVEENLARQPSRTPGRQVERGARQFQRIARRRKAGHQLARTQCIDQHRQKGRRGGDVEDVGVRPNSHADEALQFSRKMA
jgi:hypothetical protein